MGGALASLYEEVGEEGAALVGEEAGGDFDLVVGLRGWLHMTDGTEPQAPALGSGAA